MPCQVVAISHKMPDWCKEACGEYWKRLSRFVKCTLIEIPTRPHADKEAEGQKILHAIPSSHFVIALDEHGESWSTVTLSKKIATWQQTHPLTFVIGGANGLASSCLTRSNVQWSLSLLTFPHALVRVLLLEQLYRAFSLLANHPYHRE